MEVQRTKPNLNKNLAERREGIIVVVVVDRWIVVGRVDQGEMGEVTQFQI